MRPAPRKAKRPRRRKNPVYPNGHVRVEPPRVQPLAEKPPQALSQSEHLHELWVTLGLADVAD